MKKSVLIVDDSIYMRMLIKTTLENEGYKIVGEAGDGDSAIEKAIELQPDLITLDNVLPDMFGLDLINTLQEEGVTSRVIVISAVGQDAVKERAKKLGVVEFLVKPFEPETLVKIVKQAFAAATHTM